MKALILDKIMSGGLAGFCGICLTQLLSLSSLDKPLQLAIILNAIAIPFLALNLMTIALQENMVRQANHWWNDLPSIIGLLTGLASVICIFWHFSNAAGILSLMCSLVAIVLYCIYGIIHDRG